MLIFSTLEKVQKPGDVSTERSRRDLPIASPIFTVCASLVSDKLESDVRPIRRRVIASVLPGIRWWYWY